MRKFCIQNQKPQASQGFMARPSLAAKVALAIGLTGQETQELKGADAQKGKTKRGKDGSLSQLASCAVVCVTLV